MTEIKIGYLGRADIRPSPAQLGNAVISETPDASSNILLDARSAADGDLLRTSLEAGKAVGVLRPTPEALDQLRAITGRVPDGPAEMLVCRRLGRGGYGTVVVPMLTQSGGGAGDDGAVREEPKLTRPAVGTVAEAFAASLGGAEGQGLVPPAFSYFGYAPSIVPISYDMSYPEFNGKPDDKVVDKQTQRATGSFLSELFVYWVNGSKTTAYYVVIARLSGAVGAGSLLADGKDNQGFFQADLNLSVTVNAGGPLVASTHSPTTTGPGQIISTLQVPMVLWAATNNGVGPVAFTATSANQFTWPSWSILDRSQNNAQWYGYQSDVWNVLQHPPETWGPSWNGDLFQDGHVRTMPDQSKGSVAFDMISAFMVQPPAFVMPANPQGSAPPPCTVSVTASAFSTAVLFHSPDGCLGARGSRQRNMFSRYNAGALNTLCDLDKIAVQLS